MVSKGDSSRVDNNKSIRMILHLNTCQKRAQMCWDQVVWMGIWSYKHSKTAIWI